MTSEFPTFSGAAPTKISPAMTLHQPHHQNVIRLVSMIPGVKSTNEIQVSHQPSQLQFTSHQQYDEEEEEEFLQFLHMDMHYLYKDPMINDQPVLSLLATLRSDERTTIEINQETDTQITYENLYPLQSSSSPSPAAPIGIRFENGYDLFLGLNNRITEGKCKGDRDNDHIPVKRIIITENDKGTKDKEPVTRLERIVRNSAAVKCPVKYLCNNKAGNKETYTKRKSSDLHRPCSYSSVDSGVSCGPRDILVDRPIRISFHGGQEIFLYFPNKPHDEDMCYIL